MTAEELIEAASRIAGIFSPSEECTVGSVAAVLVTTSGNMYSGICIDTACGLGFCAEHAAIAEMLKAHESNIRWWLPLMQTEEFCRPAVDAES